jgi:hypothetical protein
MPLDKPAKPAPKGKRKDFARINGVKMCKVSDGRRAHTCKECGTSHRFRVCPFCGR